MGEHFQAHWDVVPVEYPADDPAQPPIQHLYLSEPAAASSISQIPSTELPRSDTASTKSGVSSLKSATSRVASIPDTPTKNSTPATSPELLETELDAQMSKLSLDGVEQPPPKLVEGDDPPPTADRPRVRVAYLTEQVSHHPPVSAYIALCPSRGLEMVGIDQISAKVSGMNVRVSPGSFNKGIYIRGIGGHAEGETYHLTHPTASVNGILRGNFYITVSDSTIITCSGAKSKDGQQLRTVVEYKEESWLGRAHFLCEGVIHSYDPEGIAHHEWTKVKHVPRSRVVAQFHGSWKHVIKWKLASEPDSDYRPLMDLSQLQVIPKAVRPLEQQLPTESRRLWDNVTKNLLNKQYGEANKHKHAIEQKQRDDAAERKKKGTKYVLRQINARYVTDLRVGLLPSTSGTPSRMVYRLFYLRRTKLWRRNSRLRQHTNWSL